MAFNGFEELDMMNGLFDIEDLLDFSAEEEDVLIESAATVAGGGAGNGCQKLTPLVSGAAATLAPANGDGCRVETKIYEDIIGGEDWFASILEESNFGVDIPAAPAAVLKDDVGPPLFQSLSPVSVLEEPNNLSGGGGSGSSSSSASSAVSSASSSTAETVNVAAVGPALMLVPARARSKRPRKAAATVTAPIVPPASEGPPAVLTLLPESESYGESVFEPASAPAKKKKKKGMMALALAPGGLGEEPRKCQHCGIQKTPQWRAGPTGPKTLCNACGVRYKSGRLFPEYRPAASPTFVPALHSNSHKKVVEMRNKACDQKSSGGPSPENPAARNCDLLAYIRRRV